VSNILEVIHPYTRLAHILFGSLGLVLFWVPLATTKGSAKHRFWGKLFEKTAWLVIAFASLGVLNYVIRFTFAEASLKTHLGEISFFVVLGALSITAAIMLYQGRLALKVKGDFKAANSILFWGLHLSLLASSLGLIAFALLFKPPSFFIMIIASLFGFAVANDGYQFSRHKEVTKDIWITAHLNGMIGVGLAFYLAFGVFGSKLIFKTDTESSGWVNALPWLLPILVIIPLTVYWKNKAKRMFGNAPNQERPSDES